MRSSTRRAALAVCVALLLVTAGCTGVTNPTSTPTTNSTATPTASTTTTTPTGTWSPNASASQYPPGVADNGTLTNVTVLLDAHFAATANQSSELTVDWTGPNESSVRSYAQGPNPAPYYSTYNRTSGDGMRTTEEFYWTGSHGYSWLAVDNHTVYRVLQNTTFGVNTWTDDQLSNPRSWMQAYLERGNYSVNGTVERNGRTFVQLSADEGTTFFGESLTPYDGTVLVTPDGVVHNIDESYEDSSGKRYEGSITVDTDIEWSGPPSWVADLPQLSLSVVEDGHAVEIRNTGGAALPANTTLQVYGSDDKPEYGTAVPDANGTVTTETRLEPGDAIYVTAGADGDASSFALHDEPTRGEFSFGYTGAYAESGHTNFRLSNLPGERRIYRP